MKNLEYYLQLPYPILLTPLSDDDGGGWMASIPLLFGCWADGETQAEALSELEVVKRLWLEVSLEANHSIPEPVPA